MYCPTRRTISCRRRFPHWPPESVSKPAKKLAGHSKTALDIIPMGLYNEMYYSVIITAEKILNDIEGNVP